MNLKISSFNKGIIKSDFKRLWWLGVVNFLIMFLFSYLPYCLYSDPNMAQEAVRTFKESSFHSYVLGTYFSTIIFSAVIGLFTFSYLNHSASVCGIHGLPVKRGTLFFSHAFTDAVLVLAPAAVMGVLFLLNKVPAKFVFLWLGITAVYSFIAYALTLFSCMLTGNSAASLIITCGFAALPAIIIGCYYFVCDIYLYGFDTDTNSFGKTMENIYLMPEDIMGPKCLIYIIAGLALFAGAYFIYKARNLENHDEVVAFPKLKPVFTYVVAMVFAIGGFVYFSLVSESVRIPAAVIFGIVGIVASNMLNKKSFTLKGAVKPVAAFAVVFAAVCGIIHFDVFGYEKYIPDISKVESASIIKPYEKETFYVDGDRYIIDTAVPYFTSEDDIKSIMALHQHEIENKDAEKTYVKRVYISYNLKNGRKVSRTYLTDKQDYEKYLSSLYDTEPMKKYLYPILDAENTKIIEMSVGDRRMAEESRITLSAGEQYEKLKEALIKDLSSLGYEEYTKYSGKYSEPPVYVEVTYLRKGTLESGRKISPEMLYRIYDRMEIGITDKFENTKKFLSDNGYFSSDPKVVSAQVTVDSSRKTYAAGTTRSSHYELLFENENEIAEVEELLNKNINLEFDSAEYYNYIRLIYNTGGSSYYEVFCNYSDLPDCVKKSLK